MFYQGFAQPGGSNAWNRKGWNHRYGFSTSSLTGRNRPIRKNRPAEPHAAGNNSCIIGAIPQASDRPREIPRNFRRPIRIALRRSQANARARAEGNYWPLSAVRNCPPLPARISRLALRRGAVTSPVFLTGEFRGRNCAVRQCNDWRAAERRGGLGGML